VWDRENETYLEYQARYTAWQQEQQQAQQQRQVEQGIAQLQQSSASATLIASETALLQAGAQRAAEERARQAAEAQRRAEQSRQLADAQRRADEARRASEAARAAGQLATQQQIAGERARQEALKAEQARIAAEQAQRQTEEAQRQREIEARTNQLLAEANQRLIEETGRVKAAEQEGRVIAEIIQQASHEAAYSRGETNVPPPASVPQYDYVAAISESGLSPEQLAKYADERQAQIEFQQAQAQAAAQQQYYEQQTQAAQAVYTQPPAAPPSGEGGWSDFSQSPFANWFDVLPADQPPDILSLDTVSPQSLTPTPSQLPFVLAAIVGGAALIGFAWR